MKESLATETRGARRAHRELLLCCSRARATDEMSARLSHLAGEVRDWEHLIQLSLRHGVMPLVFNRLNTLCQHVVPPDALARLRELFYLNAARNQYLLEELRAVLALLEDDGMRAIAYKGPALAQGAYGDVALRQFNDLDLMVRPEEMARVSELLRARGYRPQWQLTRAQEAAYLRTDCERLFALEEGKVFLDVHWAVVRNYFALKLDAEAFRRRAQTLVCAGATLRTFAPEDLLIILCVHGAKDLWTRLVWIADIAALIENNGELEWPRLLKEAERAGALRMLLLGLSLAHELLDAELPPEVLRRISAESVIDSLLRETSERLFQTSTRAPGPLAESLFHLKVQGRASQRVAYLLRSAATTNPADWYFVRLPDRLFFLYYLVRPLRLLTKQR